MLKPIFRMQTYVLEHLQEQVDAGFPRGSLRRNSFQLPSMGTLRDADGHHRRVVSLHHQRLWSWSRNYLHHAVFVVCRQKGEGKDAVLNLFICNTLPCYYRRA
jgi:hypothetical protein